MNQSQAKAWLPLIQAVAEGKTIQCQRPLGRLWGWADCGLDLSSDTLARLDPALFRIKPEPKKRWCRVALFKNGTTTVETECEEEGWCAKNPNFIRWLTDRIEYELPEGE